MGRGKPSRADNVPPTYVRKIGALCGRRRSVSDAEDSQSSARITRKRAWSSVFSSNWRRRRAHRPTEFFVFVTGRQLPEPEVKIEVLHKPVSCSRQSKYGDMLLVHYDGFLESNGTRFHSSRKDGDQHPVWFTLGIQEVVKGWDKGLRNMCTGERRKLTVPAALAYGKEGKGKIPPSSTLVFDVELMDIKNGPRSHDSFKEMDINDDWKLSKEEVKEYLKKEFEKHGYSSNDTHHELMVEDIFKNEDEDKDGFISTREFVYQHDEL